jgi:hypothetical protein
MTEREIDLDHALELDALSLEKLRELVLRIEKSTTMEHLIYRELEIDQVWRLLDQGACVAGCAVEQRQEFILRIEQVHDLLGVDQDARAAAARLRALLAELSTKGVNHVVS